MQSSKKILFNLALAAGTGIFCVSIFAGYFCYKARRDFAHHRSEYVGDSFIEEDPEIGFHQRANITMRHTVPPVFTVYTDTLGLRVDRQGLKAPSSVDVLAIGCSFTWGDGVEDAATYIKVLGRKKHVSVGNAALASFGTTAALLSLNRFEHLRPKVVIYGFIEDHIARSLEPCAPSVSPYCRSVAFIDFGEDGEPFIRKPAFTSSEYSYLQSLVSHKDFDYTDVYWKFRRTLLRLTRNDSRSINEQFRRNFTPQRREQALRFLIDQLVAKTRSMDAKLIIVYLPLVTEIHPPPQELHKALEKHLDQGNVFFVDITPAILGATEKQGLERLKAGGVDAHPSEAAHEVIAETIAQVLDLALQ